MQEKNSNGNRTEWSPIRYSVIIQPYSRLSCTASISQNGERIFVSSDLFDEVFADEQPAGNWQEDTRFPEIAKAGLNAVNSRLKRCNEWRLARSSLERRTS